MSARRTHGRLRPLTLADRRKKAARNDLRGRDRAYVPQTRREGPAATPHLPPMEEAVARAREKHEARQNRGRIREWASRLLERIFPWRRRGRRGADR